MKKPIQLELFSNEDLRRCDEHYRKPCGIDGDNR